MRGRPFSISIDDFIRTGNFGAIKPGMLADEIKKVFPKPDSVNPMGDGMVIWLYSRLEFHFFDDELSLIWCDWLDALRNPQKKQFKLDRGFLNGRMDIVTISKLLKSWDKHYEVIGYYSDDKLESIMYDFSPMTFYFEGDENTEINRWELNAIGAKSDNFTHNYTSPWYKKLDVDFSTDLLDEYK